MSYHRYGKSPFFQIGKSTISMALCNSYVELPGGYFLEMKGGEDAFVTKVMS